MTTPLRALFIEDSQDDYLILIHHLEKSGYKLTPKRVFTIADLKKSLKEESWDIVIADYIIPGLDAVEVFKAVQATGLNLPFIVVSGRIQDDKASEVMHGGAHDFITKGDLSRLIPAIHREIKDAKERGEHAKIRKELVRSRTDFQTLTDSISDPFFALDDQLRFVYWNPACEKRAGIDSDQILGKSLHAQFPKITDTTFEKAITTALESKTVQRAEGEYKESFFALTTYPTENGIAVLARDETENYMAERLRIEQEEMQRQNELNKRFRHLGQLASGVAHEVRNPLNAIMSLATALFEELEENEDYLPYKEHMLSQVNRLSKLMEDLLAMGKPIGRENFQRLDLKDIVHRTLKLWSQDKSDHRLNVSFAPDKPAFYIDGVVTKIEQVITNLLDNASQHSPQDSEITIRLDSDEKMHTFHVVDQGSGLSEEAVEHLFEPFYTSRRTGTGLGLGIVKNIIESHGGTINLWNNTTGPGCTVEIRLPNHESEN